MTERRIIIDTDPGIDDAVAILLALGSPELKVEGIVAVAGNLPLGITERNARAICEFAGRPDIPVYAGCSRPMTRALLTAEHFHGSSGLGTWRLPEPAAPLQPQHGIDFTIDLLRAAPAKSVTWCALGPLTNVAMALVKAPDIAAGVAELVLMGGASRALGNTTPAAEFNIHVDPHAAAIVFDSGMPITMVPLDVTHQVRSTAPRIERIRALGTPAAAAVAELLTPAGAGPDALHDPCVIAYPAGAGAVRRRRGQCRDRMRKRVDDGDDRRRLARDQRPPGQRHRAAYGRRRWRLCAADGADRPAFLILLACGGGSAVRMTAPILTWEDARWRLSKCAPTG